MAETIQSSLGRRSLARMIKQTVLFDGAASIYHLYCANGDAQPGSVWARLSALLPMIRLRQN